MPNNLLRLAFILHIIFITPTKLFSASTDIELMQQKWPFNGIFGRFDESSLQRGFQVYREVCSACHGIRHGSYRDLKGSGYWDDASTVVAP